MWYLPASEEGEKLGFLASPSSSPHRSHSSGRGSEPLVCPHCSSNFNHLTSFLGFLPTAFPTQKGSGTHDLSHFPLLPLKGAPLLGNRGQTATGHVIRTRSQATAVVTVDQVTQISGPALPPAPRMFLPLPVLSFPI